MSSSNHDAFGPKPEVELELGLAEPFALEAKGSRARISIAVLPDEQARRRSLGIKAISSDDLFTPPSQSSDPLDMAAPFRLEAKKTFDSFKKDETVFPAQKRNPREKENRKVNLPGFQGQRDAEKEVGTRTLYWTLTRGCVWLFLLWFTYSHLALKGSWGLIDNTNVLVHEIGRYLFRWDGGTLYALGGSLMQLLLPMVCFWYFSFKRKEAFAAAVCLWWFFENLVNIARSMNTASVDELPLLGGDTHHWKYLFEKWSVYQYAQDIADIVRWGAGIGMVLMILYLLYMTLRPTDKSVASGFTSNG